MQQQNEGLINEKIRALFERDASKERYDNLVEKYTLMVLYWNKFWLNINMNFSYMQKESALKDLRKNFDLVMQENSKLLGKIARYENEIEVE